MIVSKTPLRASFFGGGTDFSNYFNNSVYGYGSVVSTTLSMYVYIIVNRRFDDKIRLVYNDNELVDSVDLVKHNIIREALKVTGITKGIEILYLADLPMTSLGVGLASSSALTVGVLNALHAYKGEIVDKETLAKEAIDIEINRLGQKIGIQDQYAVAYGGFNRYIFNNNGRVDIIPLNMADKVKKDLLKRLMLFYTGCARDSRKIFDEQNSKMKKNEKVLDNLVLSTDRAIKYINEGDIDAWGELLAEVWLEKKKFATGISNELIDDMYHKAIDAGATGGKILGAGGGGFLLFYVPVKKQGSVRKALKEYKEVKFEIEEEGSKIVYSD